MAEATRTISRDSTASDLKKGEFGYPSGHLGHLTIPQQRAFLDFKKLVKQKGYFKEAEGGAPVYPDDVTLLRYLRARRFVPRDALRQFSDTEEWRETNEINNLYRNIDVDEYNETWKLYPQWIGRRDKRGLPVYVFEVAPLNSKRMADYAKHAASTTVLNSKHDHSGASKDKNAIPPKLYRLFALYENLVNFAMPLCTALRDRPVPRTPISQANNIVDISGVGLKQFWNLRGHMQDASVLATAHYPETLDRIFIVGAPGFFPTVWEWIKRWFDPITVSKIFILSEAQAFKTLSSFIEPEDIPEKYGGKLPFKFGAGPVMDPYIAERLKFNKPDEPWPRGPLKWVRQDGQEIIGGDVESATTEDGSHGNWKLVAVGSENGKERYEEIATFTPDPVPAVEEDVVIDDEAPDRSIDFATQKVKVNPRASWASGSVHSRASIHSTPGSPTTKRRPSTSGSLQLSRPATKEKGENELNKSVPVEGDEAANKATAPAAGTGIGTGIVATAKNATTEKKVNGHEPRSKEVDVPVQNDGDTIPSGDTAKLPPVATRVNDVPLEATATELPNEKQ